MADTPAAPATGWGPGVVGSLSKFTFKGDYSLLNAGVFAGAAYTINKTTNWNSFGAYVGPSSQLVNGVTTTKLDFLLYANLLQTATYGGFGIGIDIPVFQSGETVGKAISIGGCGLVLGYQF